MASKFLEKISLIFLSNILHFFYASIIEGISKCMGVDVEHACSDTTTSNIFMQNIFSEKNNKTDSEFFFLNEGMKFQFFFN